MPSGPKITRGVRRPQRARGRKRVDALLDATESILVAYPQVDVSLAMIAETAGVPLPSVYHFFPNKGGVLVALAERYHMELSKLSALPLDPPPMCWQEIVSRRQQIGVGFLNEHPAALRLFLGAGVSAEIRNLDLAGNESLAVRRAEEFQYWFECCHVPDLQKYIALSIGLTDGIWAVSWTQTGSISKEFLVESQLAAIAYLRCYLPEKLSRRVSDS